MEQEEEAGPPQAFTPRGPARNRNTKGTRICDRVCGREALRTQRYEKYCKFAQKTEGLGNAMKRCIQPQIVETKINLLPPRSLSFSPLFPFQNPSLFPLLGPVACHASLTNLILLRVRKQGYYTRCCYCKCYYCCHCWYC